MYLHTETWLGAHMKVRDFVLDLISICMTLPMYIIHSYGLDSRTKISAYIYDANLGYNSRIYSIFWLMAFCYTWLDKIIWSHLFLLLKIPDRKIELCINVF